jgi:NAD(P)-dependent dehydrogenase (short-subunit alcohol dehydrogenase family)
MGLFTGKVGIVTGGANGIGRAAVLAYVREGAKVCIGDLESMRSEVEQTLELVRRANGEGIFVPTDVTKNADVQNLVQTAVSKFGRLDFAFNNAGVLAGGFVADMDERDFDRVISVDLKGVFLCMKHEIRYMREHGGGAIVNNASIAGLFGGPGGGAYSAAKHGVLGLTKSASWECASHGIRINAIAPGATATPMVLATPQPVQDMLKAPQALDRLAAPEEIAELVVFLSSEKSSFMLGSVVTIDGGASATAMSYDPRLSIHD